MYLLFSRRYNLDLKHNTVWTKLALCFFLNFYCIFFPLPSSPWTKLALTNSGMPRMSVLTMVEQCREAVFCVIFQQIVQCMES